MKYILWRTLLFNNGRSLSITHMWPIELPALQCWWSSRNLFYRTGGHLRASSTGLVVISQPLLQGWWSPQSLFYRAGNHLRASSTWLVITTEPLLQDWQSRAGDHLRASSTGLVVISEPAHVVELWDFFLLSSWPPRWPLYKYFM